MDTAGKTATRQCPGRIDGLALSFKPLCSTQQLSVWGLCLCPVIRLDEGTGPPALQMAT
jgi:hypothetical protein